MTRVLHVCKTYELQLLGGVERFVDGLSYSLEKEEGIHSDVLTTTSKRYAYKATAHKHEIHYFPTTFTIASCPFSFSLFSQFRKIAKEYDVIHFHFPWPFADLLACLLEPGKPIVITYHSDIVRQRHWKWFYYPLMHRFLKKISVIVATSQNLIDSSPVLKEYLDKTVAIPLGLDKDLYPVPSDETKESWIAKLKELGLSEKEPYLFIGTLRYYKGLQYLIDAVAGTSLQVLIVGGGLEEERLQAMAREKNVGNVHFLGRLTDEDKIALIQLAKAVVSPAHLRSEAFCISLLEGLMFGTPLISTELHTGTSFVNKDQYTGLVVQPASSDALREAMEAMRSNNEEYAKMALNTGDHYAAHFTGQQTARAYANVYRKLLGRS